MEARRATQEAPGHDAPPGVSAPPPTLLEEVGSSLREVFRLVQDQVQLATLEARLAGESLVAMIVAGIMMAVLLASAWLGLLAAAVVGLIGIGVMVGVAVLLTVAVNLAGALVLYRVIRHKGRHLQFPGTIRSLRSVSPDLGISERS